MVLQNNYFKFNIHLLRGISIILIVFSHCYEFSIITFAQNKSILAKMFRDTVSGGSAFFVFVSGFLFLSIYKSNLNYFEFLFKKFKYVYIPFFFFISFDLLYIFIRIGFNYATTNSSSDHYWNALINFEFGATYFLGKSFVTLGILWYVPFIMLMYSLSPFFLFYSKLKFTFKVVILFLCFIVSFFLFRNHSFIFFAIFQNVIYFVPFYLLGILVSQNEEKVYLTVGYKFLIGLLFLSLFIAYIKSQFEVIFDKKLDLIMIQKAFLCIFYLVSFKIIKSKIFSILKIFASNSFGIFFIHPVLIILLSFLINILGIAYKTESFLFYLFISILILLSSLLLVLFIKHILGAKSRYFIGT
jgi:surface polysaccharide O-acyltransferase-like enzyme